MSTDLKTIHVMVTDDERERIKAKADAVGLTVSGYARKKMGLKVLARGGQLGNKNAKGRKPSPAPIDTPEGE